MVCIIVVFIFLRAILVTSEKNHTISSQRALVSQCGGWTVLVFWHAYLMLLRSPLHRLRMYWYIYKWRNICCNSQLMYGLPIPKPVAFYRTVSLTMHFYCFYVFLLATVLTEGMKTTQREVERFVCPPFCLFVYIEKIQLREINRRLLVLICSKSPIISPGLIFVQKAFFAGLPYYHLFSRDFNFANLEKEYFAGLKFCDFEESPYLKVIKFRESSNWCSFFKLPFLYFI